MSELPSAFGLNANLILRRFARGARFEATSAPVKEKGSPIGEPFSLSRGYEKDIFWGIALRFRTPTCLSLIAEAEDASVI